jgi:cardiolipin synthase
MLSVTVVGAVFLTWFVLVLLFTPALNYRLRVRVPVSAPDFLHLLESTCQAATHSGNRAEVFTDGPCFYPAMIAAIRGARKSVNLECYIFNAGEVGDEFVRALAERARAGVIVTIVADAIGSSGMSRAEIKTLTDAGCRLEWYQPVTWYRLARLNNRTHREILVIDGTVAFVGGAGIADWWMKASGTDRPAWRDTMVRLEGPVAAALQGVFVENWLEACGEILSGPEYFPDVPHDGNTTAIVVRSSPSDRATVSRVAFQVLIEGAEHDVRIATPYFLPDRTLRAALAGTSKRGVRITIVVPGPRTDQRWVRIASRRMYGELLAAGVRILEYEPAMTHVKTLLVDNHWAIVGTTNVDNRSFEHNDEVNVALLDPAINERLLNDFERDVQSSREVTLEAWKRRPRWERMIGPIVWILERQQ